jgi:hypothetical protein
VRRSSAGLMVSCDRPTSSLAVLREQLLQCNRERERAGTHIRVVEQGDGAGDD